MGVVMTVTTLSSRAFNQDTSGAKKAAKRGPVIITDRGRPAHVLLSIEQYQRLTGGQKTLRGHGEVALGRRPRHKTVDSARTSQRLHDEQIAVSVELG